MVRGSWAVALGDFSHSQGGAQVLLALGAGGASQPGRDGILEPSFPATEGL